MHRFFRVSTQLLRTTHGDFTFRYCFSFVHRFDEKVQYALCILGVASAECKAENTGQRSQLILFQSIRTTWALLNETTGKLLGQIVQMTLIFITITIEFESFEVTEARLYIGFTLRSKRDICSTSE